uniref:Putative vesicle coat complex copii subunit sfb3 n=1 Tax=Triatoma dimidiata TaxID=72491 RepID=A0A0V0G5J3_TRIDM
MNGQPYNYSGSNSGNATPTPSSTSYPASLSSQSSRDTSPTRLPLNVNHINQEKSSSSLTNYSVNYKSQDPVFNSVYPHYNETLNSSHNRQYESNISNEFNLNSRLGQNQMRQISSLATSQVNSNVSAPNPKSQNPSLDSNPLYTEQKQLFTNQLICNQKSDNISAQERSLDGCNYSAQKNQDIAAGHSGMGDSFGRYGVPNQNFRNDNQYSAVQPGKVEHYQNQNSWPPGQSHPQMNQKPVIYPASQTTDSYNSMPSQNQSVPITMPTSDLKNNIQSVYQPTPYLQQHNNYTGSYGVVSNTRGTPYSGMPTSPVSRQTQEEPLSSGPPRTNVLGIIPYATEPVTAVSQGGMGTIKTVTSPPVPNHINPQNTTKVPPSYNQPSQINKTMQPSQPNRSPVLSSPPVARGVTPSIQMPSKSYPAQYGNNRPPDNYGSSQINQQPLYQNYNYQQQYNQIPGPYYGSPDDLANQMSCLNVAQAGYSKLWGREAVDLLKSRDILPVTKVEPPPIRLPQEYYESSNCSPEIFRCTLTKIPETKSLLDKSRLPLGVLIHPFKDLNQLSVIQCSVIVRCRSCRTYINPFVYFVDSKRWKCNLCFRVNDLPEEFQYDPLTKTYGDPSRRPEIKSATIEFIAPSEYMVRPPQPAAYVFVIDVSRLGVEAGYLQVFCESLLSQLEALPGDSRTAVGFITFDSTVHYYSLAETQAQPHQMVIVDIDDMFVPCPDNLLVNLNECLGLIRDLLRELPNKYKESYDTGSALGSALQAAYKLLAATGGRITVFQSCLANCGPGKLIPREDPAQRSGESVSQTMLNPVTDFYKKLALDCSGQHIAVDLFILNSQFVDLATLSGISKFSGGCIYHFPLFNVKNALHVDALQRTLQRYLCRKIGFESVMRLRCTRGLSIHTFHGNFFVRSTDLLSLPNVNPDAGFGMQVSIDENLTDVQNVCFQAALLYTSSKGERRIRVHTLCLPIASNLSDVLHSADQQCIIGLLAKMAVDRCHQSSLSDAREAFVNVVADMLSAFKLTQSYNSSTSLMAPGSLKLLPLYILALLKYIAFRTGQSTRLDDRVFAMCQMKSLPLTQLIQTIYPDLYPVHNLHEYPKINLGEDSVVQPPLLHLTAERIDSHGIYLMDDGDSIIIYVGHNISPHLTINLFSAPSFSSINAHMYELPELNNPESKELRNFVNYLQNDKPVPPTVQIIRDDSAQRQIFLEKLIEDKTDAGHSYYEFLQRVKVLVK